ncbi:hypothetical protein QFZ55_003973 [Streptomyces luteogriseus]|uniref:DUF2180 family protein n=1 Tax=Streptomyces luteogriseus TaxID=68233 RepID=UPI0027867ABE|nr:DUF2180 family protein [Streptomyces luteogriseus]MDQ0714521.1 hypothetical protein [Streptomyces luteogriseus]
MHCLDCTGTGAQVTAVGVCAQCGAAVRAAHADISEQYLTCIKPVSHPVATEPPVRRLLCGTCAAAHRAHTACCPETNGMVRTS